MNSDTPTTNPYHEIAMLSGRIGKSPEQYRADQLKIAEIKSTLPEYHRSEITRLEDLFWNKKNKIISETITIKGQLDGHRESLEKLNQQ